VSASDIASLYSDAERCAESAGLRYLSSDSPGIRRRRSGRGFAYRTPTGKPVTAAVKRRINAMAIPPAWTDVWICPSPNGHLLATGSDARGRKQYHYHPQWRELRDLLNAYRLITVAQHLPAVRQHVIAQLRRRTLDRDQVLAAIVHIIDVTGMRIGNEVYADDNDSFGLTTLARRHVTLDGDSLRFEYPAKSGRRAVISFVDRPIAQVTGQLLAQRKRRLFTIDDAPITSTEVNELLADLSDGHISAKDFRTWRGTRTAFTYLRDHREQDDASSVTVAAVDAAATELHNTRAVARAAYIHPHVLAAFEDGAMARHLAAATRGRRRYLSEDERQLASFLQVLLAEEYGRHRSRPEQ
jgi:DNA topoisomerase-1